MRLPYLQIANEVIDQAPDLAVLVDWDEAKAGWGMVKAISWALKRCPDDAPPSVNDVVRGPEAAKLIARAFGYRGPPEKLVTGCEQLAHPLLERVEDGIRFRGLDRYNAAWGKSHPELWKEWKERLAVEDGPAPEPVRPEPVAEPALQTQTQTQTEVKKEEKAPAAEAAPLAEQAPLELEPSEPNTDHQHPLQELWDRRAHPCLPRWEKLSKTRKRIADARLKERSLQEYALIIDRINASPFLLGANDRDWKVNLDWLLKPENLQKVLEGNYPAPKPAQNRPGIGAPPLSNCAVCGEAAEAVIGEGIHACYRHISEFEATAERAGWEQRWEHAAEWVEAMRAQEVAA